MKSQKSLSSALENFSHVSLTFLRRSQNSTHAVGSHDNVTYL